MIARWFKGLLTKPQPSMAHLPQRVGVYSRGRCWWYEPTPETAAEQDRRNTIVDEIERLRPHYQSGSHIDAGRRQMLDHFEKFILGDQQ